jgi:hypothetical protein
MPDKDEVPGSSPGRPTTHRRRSERCQQRAGRARCRLGPRWGRTPIPAGTSPGPSGAAHPGVRLGDDHPPWSRTQPRTPATRPVPSPRAAARAVATAQPPSTGAPHGGLACLVARRASAAAAARTHPGASGSATDLPPANAMSAAAPACRPPRPSSSRRRPGSHRASIRPGGQGRPATLTWSPPPPPEWEETDASGPTRADTRRLDTARMDTGQLDNR